MNPPPKPRTMPLFAIPTPTPPHQPLEGRLTELEIKASFAEDLIDKLDQIITRQQDQIDALTHAIAHLRQPALNQDNAPTRDPRDDLPPHY